MIRTDRQPDLLAARSDLFDHTPSQAERMPPMARQRLHDMLATTRAVSHMPWNAQEAEIAALVFHKIANWLPLPERDKLRAEFTRELDRLRAAG